MDKKVLIGVIMVTIFVTSSFIPMVNNSDNYNNINSPDYASSYTWNLNGYTCVSKNSNSYRLTIVVTSYSSSSYRSTTLCFIVSNKDNTESVHSINIDSTGTYSYSWNPNLKGDVHLHAKYISLCTVFTYGNKALLVTHYYHPYYSRFGGTCMQIDVKTWSLSGYTYGITHNHGYIDLYIDVSYYSSSYGSTQLYFMLGYIGNTHNIKEINIDGTGLYEYTYKPSYIGNMYFYARYLSKIGCSYHYSEFGGSFVHKYFNYIGYDGNNTIYLSNICHQPTYGIYGQNKMPYSESKYNGNGVADNSVDIGRLSFTEYESGSNLYIGFNITNTGAGIRKCSPLKKDITVICLISLILK